MVFIIKQRIGKEPSEKDVDDNLAIVRYIKLSTFLFHLANEAFVPNLRTLQRNEPLEARIPLEVWRIYGERLWPHLQNFQPWLFNPDRLVFGKAWLKNQLRDYLHDSSTFDEFERNRLAAEIWLDELSSRRCVWCWNDCTEGPSRAMWEFYGEKGIAITSRVGLVKRALEEAGASRALVARVSYTIPRQILSIPAVAASMLMLEPVNLHFPYLFKDASYRFEEEIRFVFGSDASIAPGITLDLDPRSFIEDVWFSEDIVEPERRLIKSLLERSGTPCFVLPPATGEETFARFGLVEDLVPTATDDVSGLYRDLDVL